SPQSVHQRSVGVWIAGIDGGTVRRIAGGNLGQMKTVVDEERIEADVVQSLGSVRAVGDRDSIRGRREDQIVIAIVARGRFGADVDAAFAAVRYEIVAQARVAHSAAASGDAVV